MRKYEKHEISFLFFSFSHFTLCFTFSTRKRTTIPRPPSIEESVDGDKKSPATIMADGLMGDNLAKNVCTLGKFVNS